jgi:hypothetical protein
LGLLGLDGDVGGQLGEVDSGVGARSPQLQRFLGGGQQHGGVVLAPGAARVADQKAGQAGMAEPDQAIGVGVAGQQRQRGLAVVGSQRLVPGRSEQLQLGVKALKDRSAALDEG